MSYPSSLNSFLGCRTASPRSQLSPLAATPLSMLTLMVMAMPLTPTVPPPALPPSEKPRLRAALSAAPCPSRSIASRKTGPRAGPAAIPRPRGLANKKKGPPSAPTPTATRIPLPLAALPSPLLLGYLLTKVLSSTSTVLCSSLSRSLDVSVSCFLMFDSI